MRMLPGRYHFGVMLGIPLAMSVWGAVKPRIYTDGRDRVRNGRQKDWISLAVSLLFLFVLVGPNLLR